MNRIALTVALVGLAGAAFAQKPNDVPPHNCGAKPEYPGRLAMTSDTRRRAFEREVARYSECFKAYVEDRKKAANDHMAAGNAAIEEYNAVIKKIREEEEAARQQ